MASLSRKSVVAALLLLPLVSTEDISLAALRAAKYTTQEAIDPASSDVYALLATLQHSPHTAEAEDAARELRSLVADGAHADAVVISGGVGDLLTLLRSGGAGAREQAAGVLRRLAFDAGRAMAVADAGAAAPLVSLALDGTAGARANAARALGQLAIVSEAHAANVTLEGAVVPIVALVADANATADARLAAATALGMIGSYAVGAAEISATNVTTPDGVVSAVTALEELAASGPNNPTRTAALVALERLADNGVTTVASAWISDAHFGGWDATVVNATTGDADYTADTVPWWVNRTDGERQTEPPPGVSWNGTVLKSEL